MPRTPEQVAADDALDAAVNMVREAYWPSDNDAILLHYVVVGAERSFDADDGTPCTSVFTHTSGDDGIPAYQMLGLFEIAANRMRRHDDGLELRHPED